MDAWVAVAISTVGAVGGTALGARIGLKGAQRISREERAAAERSDVVRAFGLFLGALYPSVAELQAMPPVGGWRFGVANVINRVRGPVPTWVATVRNEHNFDGGRRRELSWRLAATVADLQVRRLPPDVRAAVAEATGYVQRLGQQRSPELVAEWERIRLRLMAAAAELHADSGEVGTTASHLPSHTLPTNDDGQRAIEAPASAANARELGPPDA
jgi:hypothetical protein